MKRTLLVAICLTAAAGIAQIPTAGLVERWEFSNTFDTGSGIQTMNSSSTSVLPTFTVDRCGVSNGAVHLDGVDDYLEYTLSSTVNVPVNDAPRSISFWMKTDNTVSGGGGTSTVKSMFNYGKSVLVNGQNGGSFEIDHNYCTNGLGFDVSNEAITRPLVCLTNDVWHHIVAIWNGGSSPFSNIIFYVDGNQVSSQSCQIAGSSQPLATLFSTFSLGKTNDPVDRRHFKGDLDDYYFYSRAITQAEVMQLFNAQCGFYGPSTFCRDNRINTYSTSAYVNATYTWSWPPGWTIVSGSGTNTITLKAGPVAAVGQITVSIGTACGTIIRTYSVTLDRTCSETTGLSELQIAETQFELKQNVPNPYSGSTIIEYKIATPFSKAQLVITNAIGQVVATENNIQKVEGKFEISGSEIPAGIYFYSLIIDGMTTVSKKMIRE